MQTTCPHRAATFSDDAAQMVLKVKAN